MATPRQRPPAALAAALPQAAAQVAAPVNKALKLQNIIEMKDFFLTAGSVEIGTLLNNGLYYQQSANLIGALVSYSSAATYIHAIDSPVKNSPAFQMLLGYIEQLNERAKEFNVKSNTSTDDDDSKVIEKCRNEPKKGDSTFADVIGAAKEKELITTALIKPLVYPNLFTKAAKGVLLYGPPGTGKTFIVKALQKELSLRYPEAAEILFFPLTGADLKGKYVGETEKKIVEAYRCAAKWACQKTTLDTDKLDEEERKREALTDPAEKFKKQYVSIIFIDEFDSIGRDRSQDETGMMANSVNTLLQMMDGVTRYENVVTVAATNYPWELDAALLRRFNEHIYFRPPRFEDVKKLIDFEMKERFTYIMTNYFDYCLSTKVKGLYRAQQSAELFAHLRREAISVIKDRAKKELKEFGEKSIAYKIALFNLLEKIDISYLNNNSPEMMALVARIAAQKYSNSDVSSVAQKAFNSVAQRSIDNGEWRVIRHKVHETQSEENFLLSCFTKVKDISIFSSGTNVDIQTQALIDNEFMTKNMSVNPKNLIKYKGTDRYIDINQITNPYEDKNKHSRVMIPTIQVDGSKYINLLFINDRPNWLILDSFGIDAIYVRMNGANSINMFRVSPGLPVNANNLAKQDLDVIFTRTLNVTNDDSGLTPDLPYLNVGEAKRLVDDIKGWEASTSGDDKLPIVEIRQFFEYIWYPYIKFLREKIDSSKGSPITKEKIAQYEKIYSSAIATLTTAGKESKTGMLTFTDFSKDYERLIINVIAHAYRSALGVFGLGSPAKVTTAAVQSEIAEATGEIVKWLTPQAAAAAAAPAAAAAAAPAAAAAAAAAPIDVSVYEKWISKQNIVTDKETSKSIKRTFFLKTTIKPFSAEFKEHKAGASFFTEGLFNMLKGLKDLIGKIIPGLSGKSEEDTDNSIRTYLSAQKVSFLDYLLARVSHIGILNHDGDDGVLLKGYFERTYVDSSVINWDTVFTQINSDTLKLVDWGNVLKDPKIVAKIKASKSFQALKAPQTVLDSEIKNRIDAMKETEQTQQEKKKQGGSRKAAIRGKTKKARAGTSRHSLRKRLPRNKRAKKILRRMKGGVTTPGAIGPMRLGASPKPGSATAAAGEAGAAPRSPLVGPLPGSAAAAAAAARSPLVLPLPGSPGARRNAPAAAAAAAEAVEAVPQPAARAADVAMPGSAAAEAAEAAEAAAAEAARRNAAAAAAAAAEAARRNAAAAEAAEAAAVAAAAAELAAAEKAEAERATASTAAVQVLESKPINLSINWYQIKYESDYNRPLSFKWLADIPSRFLTLFKGFPAGEKDIHFEAILVKAVFSSDTFYVEKIKDFSSNFRKCFKDNMEKYLDKVPEIGYLREVYDLLTYYPSLIEPLPDLIIKKPTMVRKIAVGGATVAAAYFAVVGAPITLGVYGIAATLGLQIASATTGSFDMRPGAIFRINKDAIGKTSINALAAAIISYMGFEPSFAKSQFISQFASKLWAILSSIPSAARGAASAAAAAPAAAKQGLKDFTDSFSRGSAAPSAPTELPLVQPISFNVSANATMEFLGDAPTSDEVFQNADEVINTTFQEPSRSAALGPRSPAAPADPAVPAIQPVQTNQTIQTNQTVLNNSGAPEPNKATTDSNIDLIASRIANVFAVANLADQIGAFSDGIYYYFFIKRSEKDKGRYISIKQIEVPDEIYKDINRLSFYMDPSFLSAAAAEYPSTWDNNIGKALEDYDANRALFMEQLRTGKRTLKRK
jgi:SpoVK/Ycf46/Vps4 family AAA+-type ATPase